MVTKTQKLAVMVGVGMLASLVMLPRVYADLVLDSPELQNSVRVDERENSRSVVQSARKAEVSAAREAVVVQAPIASAPIMVQAAPQPAPAVVYQQQPAAAPANDSGAVEVQHLSKSELLRRKRVREELRNEDVLQERLEELRLRDEQKRSDQIIPGTSAAAGVVTSDGMATGFAAAASQPQTTVISGNPPMAAAAPVAAMPAAPVAAPADRISTAQASTTSTSDLSASEKSTTFSISPRAGMSSMGGVQAFDITPHFSAGVGLGISASENISIELGWLYSEYGVKTNTSNPYVAQYQYSNPSTANNPNFQALALKQNIFELGMKLALMNSDSKIRPFIGFGGGYSKGYINYDQQVISYLNQTGAGALASDYELTQYLGYLSTGLDVNISKHLSIGLTGRYYTVLSANENTQINNAAVANGYGGYNGYSGVGYAPYGYAPSDQDKRLVSGSLAKQSFYSLLAGVTFSF